jgi:hypothetical protein
MKFSPVLIACCLYGAAAFAHAGEGQSAAPLQDPMLPASARAAARAMKPAGNAELRAQVERKLRARFEEADVEHLGSITREQAQTAHLGLVVKNFDAIDSAHQGRVTFEDFRRFLRARGARNL